MRRLTALLPICLVTLACVTSSVSALNARTPAGGVGRVAMEDVRAAADRGLRRLEQGAENYVKNRNCFSCHHNSMTVFAQAAGQQRGFTIEPARFKQQLDFTLASFKSRHDTVRKGQGVGGSNTTVAYALATLEAGQHRADETTAALVDFLLVKQREDGAWPGVADRPPSEGSAFTSTTLALSSLKAYGEPAAAADPERREKLRGARKKGHEWLSNAKALTTEDKVFHLRGLVAAEVDKQAINAATESLLGEQRESGAWAQLPELAGDAYATGSVLVALRLAGLPKDHPAFRHGVRFLVYTQKEDGSWFVQTRSKPVQLFFDNGDPGGKSQFISMSATGWATLALIEALPIQR